MGRSLQDLVSTLSELHSLKVDLHLHQQAVDTTTPAGKALFGMMGVFAEFERAMLSERVRAGLARTKAKGTKLGRRPVGNDVEDRIRKLRASGMGMLKIGKELGVGTSVVQRVVAGR
jgi:DNA invertase Pin-like site-specific DNA recombinase